MGDLIKTPQTFQGATVFVEGIGFAGRCDNEKIKLPVIEELQETITAGGFESDYGTGILKKMEFEVVLNEYNPMIFEAMQNSLVSGKGVTFTIKGSILQDGEKIPFEAHITSKFSIEHNASGKVEVTLKGSPTKYLLEVGGKQYCSIDTRNIIAIIGGVDYLETLRSHIL